MRCLRRTSSQLPPPFSPNLILTSYQGRHAIYIARRACLLACLQYGIGVGISKKRRSSFDYPYPYPMCTGMRTVWQLGVKSTVTLTLNLPPKMRNNDDVAESFLVYGVKCTHIHNRSFELESTKIVFCGNSQVSRYTFTPKESSLFTILSNEEVKLSIHHEVCHHHLRHRHRGRLRPGLHQGPHDCPQERIRGRARCPGSS
jgi:hypothetical protein